jgi:hypothetical protein
MRINLFALLVACVASVASAQSALPVVHIDQAYLDANPGWPKPLKTSAHYVLDVDLDSPTSALAVCASPIEIDINKHVITFGNTDPPTVPDGGFEAGAIGSAPQGWDMSGAAGSTVRIVKNDAFLYGKNMLGWTFAGGKPCVASAQDGVLILTAPAHGLVEGAGVMVEDVRTVPSLGSTIAGSTHVLDADHFSISGLAPITSVSIPNGFFHNVQSITCRLTIPVPNRQYFASMANGNFGTWDPKTTRGVAIRLEAFDPGTGKRYPDYAMVDGGTGQHTSGQVIFKPTSTSVDIRVTILPGAGGTDATQFGRCEIALDHFNVTPTGDVGITATHGSASALRGMPQVSYQAGSTSGMDNWNNTYSKSNYKKAGALSVSNGSIVEGRGHGAFGIGILATLLDPAALSFDGLDMTLTGDNSVAINVGYGANGTAASNRTIKNCNISYVGEFDVVLRSQILGAIHVASNGPHGTTTVDNCMIDNYPHFGITVSAPSPVTGSTVMSVGQFQIINNHLYPNLWVTNGYAVGVSASNVEVAGNTVEVEEGRSGRGIYVEAETDHTHFDIDIHDNDLKIFERGNREYADTISPSRCLRLRNIAPRSAFRRIKVRRNRALAICGLPGYNQYANALRMNLVNWNGNMNDADISFDDNVFESRLVGLDDPGSRYEPAAISIDNCDLGVKPIFRNNTLRSSQHGMRLLFVDSGGPTVVGDIQFLDTHYEKSTEGFQGRTYISNAMGYWGTSVGPITCVGDAYGPGTSRSPWLQRAMPITVDFWQRLRVSYTDMEGLPGAMPFRVLDKATQVAQVASTADDGQWIGILLAATARSVSGRLVLDRRSPFSVEMSGMTQTVNLDADGSAAFIEPKPPPVPIGEPVQIGGQTFVNEGETDSGYIILKKPARPKSKAEAVRKGQDKRKRKG